MKSMKQKITKELKGHFYWPFHAHLLKDGGGGPDHLLEDLIWPQIYFIAQNFSGSNPFFFISTAKANK